MEDSSQKSNASRPKLMIPKSVMKEHFKTHPSGPVKGPLKPSMVNNFPVFDPAAKSTVSLQAVEGLKLVPHSALADKSSSISKDPFICYNNLCKSAAQLVFKQMEGLMEILPKMSNVERKQHLISMALKSRELFYKLSVIADFLTARSNDVQLVYIALRALRKYDLALVQVADSLAFSIGQALHEQSSRYEITDAIDLITCGTCFNRLPSMMLTEFCETQLVPDNRRPVWIKRLNNLLKSNLLNIPTSNCRLYGIANGIAEILFHTDVLVRVTLVPVFENRTVSWYFLSVKMLTEDRFRQLSNALIAHLQSQYNGRQADGTFDFIDKVSSDIALLKVIYTLNALRVQFEQLKRNQLDDLELLIDDLSCFTVRFWQRSLASKAYSIKLNANNGVDIEVECSWVSDNRKIQSHFDVDPDFAKSVLADAFRHHSKAVCERFVAELISVTSSLVPLYARSQFNLIEHDDSGFAIAIDMPKEPILLTVSPKSGKLRMGRKGHTFPPSITSLLTTDINDLSPFVRCLRQVRNDDICERLDELLANNSDFVLVDQNTFQLPVSLSSNALIVALKKFHGKYVVLEWAIESPKLYLLFDPSASSSVAPRVYNLNYSFSATESIQLVNFDFSCLIKAFEMVKKDVILEGLKHDLEVNGIVYERSNDMSNNLADFMMLNIGTPPSIKHIKLVVTDTDLVFVELEIMQADLFKFEANLLEKSKPSIIMHACEGRFDFSSMLSRIRSFVAFMIIAIQLRHRNIDFVIGQDRLEFTLPEAGVIQLIHDPKLKLHSFPMQHRLILPQLYKETTGLLQDEICRSVNASVILDFLERCCLSNIQARL